MPKSESIARVLAGQASYDELDADAQAEVRAAWDTLLTEDIRALNLAERLRASGRPWYEADEDGNVVVRGAGPASPA